MREELYDKNGRGFPQVFDDRQTQSEYERLRASGESHNMAELIASRDFPGMMTDNVFLEGRHNEFAGGPMAEAIGKEYKRVAEKHGQTTEGKVYMSGLAKFPGDPEAWVAGRSDVRKVLAKRGWSGDGAVKYKPAVARDHAPDIGLANDIVEGEVQDIIDKEPDAAPERAKIKEKVRAKRKPHWAK